MPKNLINLEGPKFQVTKYTLFALKMYLTIWTQSQEIYKLSPVSFMLSTTFLYGIHKSLHHIWLEYDHMNLLHILRWFTLEFIYSTVKILSGLFYSYISCWCTLKIFKVQIYANTYITRILELLYMFVCFCYMYNVHSYMLVHKLYTFLFLICYVYVMYFLKAKRQWTIE